MGSAPEPFGIAAQSIGSMERRNLAAIASLITHVATQDFDAVNDRFVTVPLQEYIKSDGVAFRDWVMEGELA
jgi:Ras GTPase-activating-like protein IQGAP2/3